MPDKYTAVWVSHSSISDFLRCPRAYFLKNVYRQPGTNRKVKLVSPAMALGAAVHETLESLSVLPRQTRFGRPLNDLFDASWKKVSGKAGGFYDKDVEFKYQTRGREMIWRVEKHPGVLADSAVKIQQDLPYYWLSEEDNIILCGKIDWLVYKPETDSVHIIDFKTGKVEEDGESLQLPIYHLLVHNCQQRAVTGASYWYLDRDDAPTPVTLPSLDEAQARVIDVARKIKLARQLEKFKCLSDGCGSCTPYERIIRGEADYIGVDEYKAEIFALPPESSQLDKASVIL